MQNNLLGEQNKRSNSKDNLPNCAECKNVIESQQDEYCETCLSQLIKNESQIVDQLNLELIVMQSQVSRISDDVKKMEFLISKEENMEQIIQKEKSIEKEILDLEKKEREQNDKLLQLKQDILQLERNEDDLWIQINKFSRKLFQLFENSQIADNTLEQLNSELERLNKIDIVNDLFRISVQDDVAVLNRIIVGKKSDQQIDWDDMNAALGHLCVIVVYLVKKFGYVYQNLERIECNGSTSRIELKTKTIFNLFVLNKNPQQKEEDEFNDAFVNLFIEFGLFCKYLQDADLLKKRKIQLNIPFKFNGQMIADKSINLKQYPTQKWDNWTEAVKRFFANVKSVISMNSQFDLAIQQEEYASFNE